MVGECVVNFLDALETIKLRTKIGAIDVVVGFGCGEIMSLRVQRGRSAFIFFVCIPKRRVFSARLHRF